MKTNKVIEKVYNKELSVKEAYQTLYQTDKSKPKLKKARFVKLSIKVPEEDKGVNAFLKVLFAIPIPLVFARLGLRFANKHTDEIDLEQINELINYAKGTVITVDATDAKVKIKIF